MADPVINLATVAKRPVAELLAHLGLKSNEALTPEALEKAFLAAHNPVLEEITANGGTISPTIRAKLDSLKASYEQLKLQFIPVAEGGLSTNGYLAEIPKSKGLINTLFQRPNGEFHPGKVGTAIAVGASLVAAVVGYFMLRDDKPKSQVDSVTDAELLATLNSRQV